MTDRLTKRRKFLQSAGVGGTALLAGCTSFFESVEEGEQDGEDDDEQADSQQTDTNPTDTQDGTDSTDNQDDSTDNQDDSTDNQNDNTGTQDGAEVGIIAIVDQEAMQEIQAKLQNQEIDQEEANKQQDELIQEAIDAVVTQVENTDGVQVDEAYSELGAVVASGAPGGLIDILNSDATRQLIPAQNVKNAADG
jgi:hypothetical protein